MSGQSWLSKRQSQAEQSTPGTMLPDIARKRAPMNDTFQSMGSMGRMTGAAGFKRDN